MLFRSLTEMGHSCVKAVAPGFDEIPLRLKVVNVMEDSSTPQPAMSGDGREQSEWEAHLEAWVLRESMGLGEALALDPVSCQLPESCPRCSQAPICNRDSHDACDVPIVDLVVQVETFSREADGARPESWTTRPTQPPQQQHPNIIWPPAVAVLADPVDSNGQIGRASCRERV